MIPEEQNSTKFVQAVPKCLDASNCVSSPISTALRSPTGFVLHHRVDDNEKLPHARGNGNFKAFSRCPEPLIKSFDFGIAPYGRNSAHV